MIQEQLKKIEKEFDERFTESEFCFGIGKIRRQEIADFLRTSALELVKNVVEQEIERLEKLRTLEIEALENAKLVPDRHYHKGKIHLIDDSIANLKETLKQL